MNLIRSVMDSATQANFVRIVESADDAVLEDEVGAVSERPYAGGAPFAVNKVSCFSLILAGFLESKKANLQ